ncbi:MAG: hypothetical protein JSW07_05965 [bacterium]|nr:MAG: hypothetical protein JSW07_05965 [bacterium]
MFDKPVNENELKLKFADALLRSPENPWVAAKEVTDDVSLALQMSQLWVKDPIVVAQKEKLLSENGAKAFLPTKEDFAREVLVEARDAFDPDSKHKFYKLFGDSMGFIEKPSTNVSLNTQNITNRVMMVPVSASDEEWQEKLKNQQEVLADESKLS